MIFVADVFLYVPWGLRMAWGWVALEEEVVWHFCGLVIFLYVKLQSCDRLHIYVAILDPVSNSARWRFTGFYGESRRELRYRSYAIPQH